jgi:Tol biopolymer transport system component
MLRFHLILLVTAVLPPSHSMGEALFRDAGGGNHPVAHAPVAGAPVSHTPVAHTPVAGAPAPAAVLSGVGSIPDTTEANGELPLEAARRVEFATNEGTWISVDVSPDGTTLVFDLLGDIHLLPVEGGESRPLTRGIAYDAQPRFSPDGRRILFVSDRSGGENLWTMDLQGGDLTRVTSGEEHIYTSPEWTPDGEYVVASRTHGLGGTAKLWLFHRNGGSGIQLISEPENLKTLGAAFGPDPRFIWFAEATGDWQYNASLPRYQLAVFDRRMGTRTQMSAGYGSGFRPALSPDGRWLVYGSRYEAETGLRIRDLTTGDERWLAYPVQRDDQEARATLDVLPGYAFTPDSRAVVVSYGGKLWRVPVEAGASPSPIPFTATVEAHLGPELFFQYPMDDGPMHRAREIRNAVPSPDGSRLAYTAFDRLYVSPLPEAERGAGDGRGDDEAGDHQAGDDQGGDQAGDDQGGDDPREIRDARRVTDSEYLEFHPTWSPDGRWIAYGIWDPAQEVGHLYRASADGSGTPQRLTTLPGLYQQPAWSPDGNRIVAIRGDARNMREEASIPAGGVGARFVWVPAGGGEIQDIGPTGGRTGPHFASLARGTDPSSDRIFAFSGSDGLVSFRFDGTDERAHLEVTGATQAGGSEPRSADRILMSPRGGEALAEVEGFLYRVAVPQVGADPPSVSVTNPERAAVPVDLLTEIGGHFPAWSADGTTAHWSIGNAHAVHRLDPAAGEDSGDEEVGDPEAGEERNGRTAEFRLVVERPRDLPQGTVVLRGGRALTMVGHEIIEDADVVVEGHRIAAVGTRGSVEVPTDARIIDVSGTTLLPGFVDTHAHIRPPFQVHSPQPWSYLANLAYGVTTTRDPQTSTTDVLTYFDRVEVGDIVGPRVYSTGPGVFGRYRGAAIEDLDHARNLLTRYSEYYQTESFKMYLAGNRIERQWLVMAARELGLRPTTEAGIDYKLDVTHALDGYPGIEHNLPISPIYSDVVRVFAESGTTNTPTLLVAFGSPMGENLWFSTEDPYHDEKLRRFTPQSELARITRRRGFWAMEEEYAFPRNAEFIRDVVAEGGRAGVGSHGQLQGLGYHWELWSMQAGGMPEHDALRVATVLGAEAVGMDGDLGTLEAGKLADIVVLEDDPLADIRATERLRYVMRNGRLHEAESLREIWPRERELPHPGRQEPPPDPPNP